MKHTLLAFWLLGLLVFTKAGAQSCTLTLSKSYDYLSTGQSAILSYQGCTGGTVTWNQGLGTGNNKRVSPTATTTYSATCTPASGTACSQSITVNFIDCSVSASASPSVISSGQSSVLSYTGCVGGSVDWVTSNDIGVGSGNNIIVTPTASTTYIAQCNKDNGYCLSYVTVTVSNCAITASASSTLINAGQSSVLSYTGCSGGTVSWDNGLGTGNNKTVTPSSTTTYKATCVPSGGGSSCSSSVTVTVTPCSIIALASSTTINAGQSTELVYENCTNGTVTWNQGAGNGNNIVVSPSATITYQATCTPTGGGTPCTSSVTVTVIPCNLSLSANPSTITSGQNSLLTYTGCTNGTVSWNNGLGNGNNKTVTPTATTTYSATCTPTSGGSACVNSVTVTVNTPCSVSVSASPATINAGQSSLLTYAGCSGGNVSWDNGLGAGNNKTVSPSATTTYVATCSPAGGGSSCTSSVTVTVNGCLVIALASSTTINAGQTTTLAYENCTNGTVTWNQGAGNGNNLTVSPSTTTTYQATCTPTGGGTPCTSTVTVTVSTCNFTVNASPANINAGQSSVLSYSGCTNGTVSWDNGLGTGNNKSVSPTATTTYQATCTPTGGGTPCNSSITVTVSTCNFIVGASPSTLNAGQSSVVSFTGCTNGTVSWDNGLGSGNNLTVTPSITTTYQATCTPTGGGTPCNSSVTVTVIPCNLSTSASPTNINAGQSSVLTYTGCTNGNLSWDNGLGSGNTKTVSPSATTTYSATCTPSGGGTPCTSSVTVNVCNLSVSASPSSINSGQSSLLTYSGCSNGTVSWDNGLGTGNNKTVSPSVTTTYSATCTPSGGGTPCTSSITVTVSACQLSVSASPSTLTIGQSSVLSYTGCSNGTVSWDNSLGSGNNKTVMPSATTTYMATCTPTGGGTPCTSSVTVTVNAPPCSLTTSASSATINSGLSTVLSYSGCTGGTVTWDNGLGTGNNKTVSPLTTITYNATCTPPGGGSDCTSSLTVTVHECSLSTSASSATINAGQSTILSYTGCTYGLVSWDNGGGTGNNLIVSPSATTTYQATCTPTGGGTPCTSSVTVTVNTCNLTTSASPVNINAGQNSILTYTGCANGTVSWDNGLGTGNAKTVSPSATTTYQATCTPTGGGTPCTSTLTVNVSSCNFTIDATPAILNAGQSSVLSYSGCTNGTVSWDNGLGAGNDKTVNPSATTTYQATCTPTGGGTPCTSSITVTVRSCNLSASASPTNINAGQSSVLTYTGCENGTVSWDNGAGIGNSISVSPSTTTTYSATCTPTGGGTPCTNSVTVTVSTCNFTVNASPSSINAGQSSVLSYSGCTNGTVSWDNGLGTGNNKTVNPTVTTTYNATCSPLGGGGSCTSSVTVTVNGCSLNTSASPSSINAGQSSLLTFTGCSNGTVSWDNGLGSGNNKTVSPSITTTYSATCTPSGGGNVCTSSVAITVNSPCSISASASPSTVNAGQSSVLSYVGCTGGSVTWDNGLGNGTNKTVSPSTTTTYQATCTPNGGGTSCTSSVTLIVNAVPCSLSTSASATTINAGQSSLLTYSGCSEGTVSWNNGLGSGNNKTVSPSVTTTYQATCTPAGGESACTSSVTVTVIPCSLGTSATSYTINAGQSSVLTFTGCTNGIVSWDNGLGTGNNKTVNPSATTTYMATCTPNGGGTPCTSFLTVTVNTCNLTSLASPANINAGQSSLLTYSGCSNGTVSWDNGLGSGNNKIVNPSATTTYQATCTPSGGGTPCTSSVTVTVSTCNFTVNASPANINLGQSSVLTYSGCSNGTVSWDNGLDSGNNLSVSPSVTTTYSATCSPTGGGTPCTSTVTVMVSTPCSVSVSASPATINSGQSSLLTYAGCSGGTVSWDNGLGTGNNKTVSPSATTTYVATCSPAGGGSSCTSSVTVTVNGCSVIALASSTIINAGQTTTLAYENCTNGTVTWNQGAGNGNNLTVSPSATTTYQATCTPTGGGTPCTSSVTITVSTCNFTMNASPSTINTGQSSVLSYNGCSNGTVSWDNGLGSGNNLSVSPSATTIYNATCTPNSGGTPCTSSITITVLPCTLSTSASSMNINAGQSSLLTYTGCSNGTVSWDNGAGTGNNISVSPSATTTYMATCTPTGGGTPCTSSVTITVSTCNFTVEATPSTINTGQSSVLSYNGCSNGTVSWDKGLGSGNSKTINPSATTTYQATCTPNGGGTPCTSSISITVLSCNLSASASPMNINAGQSSLLTYSGCNNGTVSWDNGLGTGDNKTVSPSATTTYMATCTPNGGGSPCTSTVTVTITAVPCSLTISASPLNINAGQSSVLAFSGCSNGTVSWDNGLGTGNNKTVSPSTTTTYSATCSPTGGGIPCTSTVTVTVNGCNLSTSANPVSINAGQNSVLTYSGCANGTVIWDNALGSGNNKVVSPTSTITYIATCIPSGGGTPCMSAVTITVNGCNLSTSASPSSINAGQSSVLTYNGCSNGTVSWDNGLGSGNNKTINPLATTTYMATCTPSGGGTPCTSSLTVNVNSCNLSTSASLNTINAGQSSVLSYEGCSNGTVNWDNSVGTGNSKTITPSATTTYLATCTPNGGGNVCTSSITIYVNSCNIGSSASPSNINAGQSSVLMYSGCSNGTVSWDNGLGSGNAKTVSPSGTTTYIATCTPNGGGTPCTSSVVINVTPCSIELSASPSKINVGQSSTLSYAGCFNGTVNWSNGLGTGNSKTVMPTATTTYQATCTPTGGGNVCSAAVTLTVTPAPIAISSSSTQKPTCVNAKNGRLTINLDRGIVTGESTIRLTLSKNNASLGSYFFDGPSFTTPEILDGGTYSVLIETLIGTTVSAQTGGSVTIANPDPVTFSLTKTNVNCFGGADGKIEINASGGTGVFFYQLATNGPTGFTNGNRHIITDLTQGNYTINVSDSFNCPSTSQSITVSQPTTAVTLTKISQKDPRGFETKDGQAVVQVNGGTPGYTFEWIDEKGDSYGSGVTTDLTNKNSTLRGGIYRARVYDANYSVAIQKSGCVHEVTFTLTEPPLIEAKIDLTTEISCFGKKDGVILITPKGGVPATTSTAYGIRLQVKNSPSSTFLPIRNSFTGLSAGQYIVTVIDANEVSRSFDYVLSEPQKVVATVVSAKDLACNGDKNGSIEIAATGGSSSYTATWSNGAKGLKISNLSAGTYAGIVVDSKGCRSDITSAQVKEPTRLDAAFTINSPTCYSACNGLIDARISGGTAPYSFAWDGRTEKATRIEKLCGGENLTFNVLDANSCRLTKTAQIVQPTKIDIKLANERNVCKGQAILLDVTNPMAKSYLWMLPDGQTSTKPTIETQQPGIYTVSLFDSVNCEFKSAVTIKQIEPTGKIRFAATSTAPVNEPIVVLNLSDSEPLTLDWMTPNGAIITEKTKDRLQFSMASLGNYTVGIRATFAECELYQTKAISIVDFFPKTVEFLGGQDQTILSISPNPASSDFDIQLRFEKPTDFKVKLYNSTQPDTVIFETTANEKASYTTKINALGLSAGIYILSVETATNRFSKRVIIVK